MNETERAALVDIVAESMYDIDGQRTNHGSLELLEFRDAWDAKKNRYRRMAESAIRAVNDNRLLAAADEPGLGFLDDLHVWEIVIDPHFGSDAQPKGYRATFLSDDEDGDSFVAASGIGSTRPDAIRAALAAAGITGAGQEGCDEVFNCPNCEGTGLYDDCTCSVCEGEGELTQRQWDGN